MIPQELLVFKKGRTVVHRLTPRTKMYFAAVFTILALIRMDLPYMVVVFLATLIPLALARIVRVWLKSLKTLAFFIAVVFLFNYLFTWDLDLSLSMVLRLLILVNVFMAFMRTTMPDDLAQTLYELGIPHDFVLAFTMSLRFIPTIMRDAQNIIDAQRARGLETEKGNPIKRAKNYIPILVPLIVNAVRRARLVAEAMESRGFGATDKPTSLYEIKATKNDWAVAILVTLALALAIYLTYINPFYPPLSLNKILSNLSPR